MPLRKKKGGGALTQLIFMTIGTSKALYTPTSNKIGQELESAWAQINLGPSTV